MEVGERWIEAKGFPRYLVSNYGRVVNQMTNEIVTPVPRGRQGRLTVYLTKFRGGVTVFVNRLIADSFFEDDVVGYEINHIDGDRYNNAIWNLEVTTTEENKEHAYEMGLMNRPRRILNLDTGDVYESLIQAGFALGLISPLSIPKQVRKNGGDFRAGGQNLRLLLTGSDKTNP